MKAIFKGYLNVKARTVEDVGGEPFMKVLRLRRRCVNMYYVWAWDGEVCWFGKCGRDVLRLRMQRMA